MKLKGFISMIMLLVCMQSVSAGQGGGIMFTYGVEWSYTGNINTSWHHFYFDAVDGYWNDDRDTDFSYRSHGEVLAHAGMDIGNKFNLSLYTGYAGVAPGMRIIPISLRWTWLYGARASASRWFSFIEGGSGICVSRPGMPYYAGKFGSGYRIPLTQRVKLDFILAVRLSYASPEIYDHGETVPVQDINRNDNFYSSISLGIGLTF